MARRANAAMMPYRKTRQAAYKVARTMGNLQPFGDFLATGDFGGLVQGLFRRGARRLAGRAWSRASFGDDKGIGLLFDVLLMVLGRLVGFRGRR